MDLAPLQGGYKRAKDGGDKMRFTDQWWVSVIKLLLPALKAGRVQCTKNITNNSLPTW